jgi:hypothetical protein
MDKQTLVDAVIEEMKRDISNNDWTAIDGLLFNVNTEMLEAFLPEKQDQEENDNEVVFLYGWKQSCLDAKGMFPVSSVDEIDPSKHWVDKAKLSEDKEAYWLELVEQYGERQ